MEVNFACAADVLLTGMICCQRFCLC